MVHDEARAEAGDSGARCPPTGGPPTDAAGGWCVLTPDYAAGFQSVETEHEAVPLTVEGSLPDWLDGVLIRNGPGRFEVGGERVAHWFDGLAMPTRYAFGDGGVTYTNRFLRSREYRSVTEEGRLAAGQFGTTGGGLLTAIRNAVLPSITDNANVNVLRLGDRLIAITETQVGIEMDPSTLATLRRHPFDELDGQMMTAHPHVDPLTGETFTVTTAFGRTSRYRFYRAPAGASRFRAVGGIETDRPAYVHSFGLTAEHLLLVEFPFDVNPLRLLIPGGGAFIEQYEWRPEAGTRIHVLDRGSGEVLRTATLDPCFAFHHANAFVDDGAIVADVAVFESPALVQGLTLRALERQGIPAMAGELRRYRIPCDGGAITTETLHPTAVTLPRIAPDRNARSHRYVYGQGPPEQGPDRPQHLLKVDTHRRVADRWTEPGTFCGEPVFVPRPDREAEDVGVVLSVLLETGAERSSLLVLDGESFEERARAPLPHVVPFDFHGQYFPEA